MSGRILDRITHGAVTPKPNIAGSTAARSSSPTARACEADVVIYCTGYKITFPFFDEDFIAAPDNRIELFRRVFHPGQPEPLLRRAAAAARRVMPLAEAQGRGSPPT